jgi:eukaryotic-like serine/threonine-protein kinase
MSSLPSRISDALSGHYRLDHEIGAGGMATVYLADDLRHDRRVALKVLRPELAAVIGAERFLAEIKLTANLQHPHILPLFDSGEAETFLYYVMPFVEGESLRSRLTREKQLPVEEAVRLASEVASALDYAHRHGVIHRDIKPENILLHDGRALVADFGIALAASKAGGSRMTETGMSLGTPHYMSPEQAMGEREITGRSDVYALGAVLYEMLTGDPPFSGSTAQAVVARVVTESPRPLIPQRHTITPQVEAAVLQALEKLPADRFATAAQFAEALRSPAATRPMASGRAPPSLSFWRWAGSRSRQALAIGVAVVAAAGLGLATWRPRPVEPAALRPVRFLFTGGDSARVAEVVPWPATISPDGGTLVYGVDQPDGSSQLFFRRSDQLDGHPIGGTTNATQPLFSPDGQWLQFEADGKEKRVRLDGSPPVTIADGAGTNGADWTPGGELVVGSTGAMHGLAQVSIAGGELVPLTHPDSARGVMDHVWPIAVSDRLVAFAIWSGALATAQLALASLDDGAITPLNLRGIRPLALLDGALVYVQSDGSVMAVPLDIARKRAVGRPVRVLDPIPFGTANNGNSAVFVSRGGALVSGVSTQRSQLMWVGRDGVSRAVTRDVRDFATPRLSPDGQRMAVIVADGSRTDIWIYEFSTGTLSRLTNAESVTSAEWNADGSKVVYPAAGGGLRSAIWAQAVGLAGPPEKLVEMGTLSPQTDIAPDGRSLLVQSYIDNRWMLQRTVLDSGGAFATFSISRGQTGNPRFSPDGRWVAMVSDETGADEVYVLSYPDVRVRVQVSVGGGSAPVWSRDSKRLYYRSGSAIMEAQVATSPTFRVVSRDTAFSGIGNSVGFYGQANYDVSRDGSRLVIPVSRSAQYSLVVVPNWITEFRERMAAGRSK